MKEFLDETIANSIAGIDKTCEEILKEIDFQVGDNIEIINNKLTFGFNIESINMKAIHKSQQVRLKRVSVPEPYFTIGTISFRSYSFIVSKAKKI